MIAPTITTMAMARTSRVRRPSPLTATPRAPAHARTPAGAVERLGRGTSSRPQRDQRTDRAEQEGVDEARLGRRPAAARARREDRRRHLGADGRADRASDGVDARGDAGRFLRDGLHDEVGHRRERKPDPQAEQGAAHEDLQPPVVQPGEREVGRARDHLPRASGRRDPRSVDRRPDSGPATSMTSALGRR